MKIIKYMIICLMLILCISYDSLADTCSKPKVAVSRYNYWDEDALVKYLNEKYPSQPRGSWLYQIEEKVLAELRMNSPDIVFIPGGGAEAQDCDYSFRYGLSLIGAGKDIESKGIKISEYIAFWMDSRLIQNNACGFLGNILDIKITKDDRDIFRTIERNIESYGSIRQRIEEFEESHRVPPRGPQMEISLDKQYVSPVKEERELDIKIEVKNCKGQPVFDKNHGQEVILPRKTSRGEIKPTKGFPQDFMVTDNVVILKITYPVGASATYTLKKGMDASEEPLKILTCGIDRKAIKEISIPIYGMLIEATPKDKVISPGETTQIEIHLFKYSLQGNRIPAANQMIDITVKGLIDGSLSPRGKVTTDKDGKAVLNYRAGEKEKRIDIDAKYQPEGYPESINAQTYVEVEAQECWEGTVQMIVNGEKDWKNDTRQGFSIIHEELKFFRNDHFVVQFYYDRKNKGILMAKSISGSSKLETAQKFESEGRCREHEPWRVISWRTSENLKEDRVVDQIKEIRSVSVEKIKGKSLFTFGLDPVDISVQHTKTWCNEKEKYNICSGKTERGSPRTVTLTTAYPFPFAIADKRDYETNAFIGEKTIPYESAETMVAGSVPYTTVVKYQWAVWRTKCRK